MVPSRIWAIALKELRLIWRDRTTLILVTLLPSALLALMAFAVATDIRHVPIAVLDFDRSSTSRALTQQIGLGEDLVFYAQASNMDDIEAMLLSGLIKGAVVIPPGFERQLYTLRGLPLQVIIDGTEPQSGTFALDRITTRAGEMFEALLAEQFSARGIPFDTFSPIDLSIRAWYNPSLDARVDLVPGILSMVLGLPGMTVALTLARERERGTFEQLLVTPISRAELLLGKILPYVIAGLVNMAITTAIAVWVFGAPFRGNFLLFLILSIAYFFAVLSMGMLIGVIVRTQAASMALSLLALFLPAMFLTGVFIPISSLPELVRLEALSLPGSHYAIITRGIFTTGAGLDVLWLNGIAMFALGLAFTAVGSLLFKKRLA